MALPKINKSVYLKPLAVLVSVLAVLVVALLVSSGSEGEPVAPGPPGYLHDVTRGELA